MKGLRQSVLLIGLVAGFAIADEQPPMMSKPSGDILSEPHDPMRCAPDGIAVGGYDLISYRSPGGPSAGNARFAVEHGDFTYLFESEENKRRFFAAPMNYLPEYKGWCAVTLALGRLTCPDYSNFRLEDGELLLFETTGFTNGRTLWETDSDGFRRKADKNYSKLLSAN